MQDPPYVTVVWGDAFSQPATDYVTPAEARKIHKPLKSETSGYLIHRDIVGVTLMSERQQDHTDDGRWLYRGHTFIPAGMIVSVKVRRSRKKPPSARPDPQ